MFSQLATHTTDGEDPYCLTAVKIKIVEMSEVLRDKTWDEPHIYVMGAVMKKIFACIRAWQNG